MFSISAFLNHKPKDSREILKSPNMKMLKRIYASAWKNKGIPILQYKLNKREINTVQDMPAIQALYKQIIKAGLENPTVLEVGCSSGFNLTALEKLGLALRYQGSDYSKHFINLARKLHPGVIFKVADATSLKIYQNKEFDIVISGCCLLHIIDYSKAVTETGRLAKKFVVFHRTPIFQKKETTYFTKEAYGVKMLEIIFNENELIRLFRNNKLEVVDTITFGPGSIPGIRELYEMKNYLCKVVS